MQVPKVVASISEVDAAPGQRRSYGRAWYFGSREFFYRQRDLVKRIVVGGMRRLVNCLAMQETANVTVLNRLSALILKHCSCRSQDRARPHGQN